EGVAGHRIGGIALEAGEQRLLVVEPLLDGAGVEEAEAAGGGGSRGAAARGGGGGDDRRPVHDRRGVDEAVGRGARGGGRGRGRGRAAGRDRLGGGGRVVGRDRVGGGGRVVRPVDEGGDVEEGGGGLAGHRWSEVTSAHTCLHMAGQVRDA